MSELNGHLREAALGFADLGYAVFPCRPGEKIPITTRGLTDASLDTERIDAWWNKQPAANIAIATAGLVVIDVDGADNAWPGDPKQALELVGVPMSLTPRGGRHYVFRQPTGKAWKNTTSKLAPNVDTRATGGYVLAPPSIVNGKPYRWAETLELDCPPDQLSEPPEWLVHELDRVVQQSGTESTVGSLVDGNTIPSGQRNDTFARLAGTMRRVGMGLPEIRAALLEANTHRCQPPLMDAEVERVAASVCRYEPDQIAVATTEDHWGQDFGSGSDTGHEDTSLRDPGPVPEHLLHIPGFIGEVMDFVLETAPYPNLAMSFCGALALQAFLAGRKVRDPGDNRTNLYLLGLAHSAAGKDWPRKVNMRIAHEIGLAGCLGDRFASGEGIQDALFITPCMLFQTDEIDGLLQSINQAKDARHESIMSSLLTLYSTASSVFPMRRKAGKESPGVIHQPCLTILGTAIPNHYYQALSERMLTNGLFARMLILDAGKRGKGQEPVIRSLPDRVVATARWWADFRPGTGNLERWHPEPVVVKHTEDAKCVLIEAREAAEAEYSLSEEANDAVGTTVWGRVSEHARKLALLYAVSESHQAPRIGEAAAEWAVRFVMHQTRRMLFMAQSHVAENPFHADCLRLLEKLRGAPAQTLNHSVLLKRMKMEAQALQKIVVTLLQQGDIELIERKTPGRTGVTYRLAGRVNNESRGE